MNACYISWHTYSKADSVKKKICRPSDLVLFNASRYKDKEKKSYRVLKLPKCNLNTTEQHMAYYTITLFIINQNSEAMCEKLSTPHDSPCTTSSYCQIISVGSHHRISIRLKTWLWLHHCNTSTLFFFRHLIVDLLVLLGSFSCCVTQFKPSFFFKLYRWPHIWLFNTLVYSSWLSESTSVFDTLLLPLGWEWREKLIRIRTWF